MELAATPAMRRLPAGAVRPLGWALAQMRRDLTEGFAGCLDALSPHVRRDLFRDRIASSADQMAWWDAESRGNWLWGYTLMAHLAGLRTHETRAAELLESLMCSQDDDGYLGIYSREHRYAHAAGENGELWAQSRALLPLIALYECTGQERALDAVRRAAALTLDRYPRGTGCFRRGDAVDRDSLTGLTHGLCYLDVLEWLHDATGDARYATAALGFYREFSAMSRPFPNDDLARPNLEDPRRSFGGHAVHTAEHLRAALWVHALDPSALPTEALRRGLGRLRQNRLPSGALLGDENIHGLAVPEAAYEYCTLTELLLSLSSCLAKQGAAGTGDWMEALAFNAAQGARLADGSAVAYLSADTRLWATASRPDSHSSPAPGRRYKFSPTHDDVACCCSPNATRMLPHYVAHQWMRLTREPGLAATCYGPCEVHTRIGPTSVRIVEETRYPFSSSIDFHVDPEQPVEAALMLRRPGWATRVGMSCPGTRVVEGAEWLRVEKTWRAGDRVRLTFAFPIRLDPYANGELAVCRGPLQYALPVAARRLEIARHATEGFLDLDFEPEDLGPAYRLPVLDSSRPDCGFAFEDVEGTDPRSPWAEPPHRLVAGELRLLPLGSTVLRRAAFPAR